MEKIMKTLVIPLPAKLDMPGGDNKFELQAASYQEDDAGIYIHISASVIECTEADYGTNLEVGIKENVLLKALTWAGELH